MKPLPWPSLILMAALVLPASPSARAQDVPARLTSLTRQEVEASLGSEWYGVYMLEKKAGFARFQLSAGADPKQAGYVATLQLTLPVVVAGARQDMRFAQTLEFDGEPPFALRRATHAETGRGDDKMTQLTRKDGGFEVVRTAGGVTTRRQLGALDYTLADIVAPPVWLRRGPKVGDRVTSRTIDFDKLQLDPEVRKLLASKTSVAEGVKVTYREVETTLPRQKITAVERYNDKGQLLSGKLAGVIELRFEPEQQAKNIEYSTDLFVLGMVKVDQPLGDAARVTGLVLEVTGKQAAAIPAGPGQSVRRNDSGTFTLRVSPAQAAPVKAADQEVTDSLAETADYPISDPKVRALLKEALKGAETPRDKVDRLVPFVAGYLTPDFQTRPRSLAQLLAVKKGACTEFALLFTTLARAAGIPSRAVIGFVYMGDDQRAFGPHAWNEVVLDGVWVPVDASWNETAINATHVRCGVSKPGELAGLAKFLGTFGKLSFRVVEVTRRP